jgi:pyruvate/2-oxoglutarate dehydrogenase complex dihydrolipoamide acyltransferase (E2) component
LNDRAPQLAQAPADLVERLPHGERWITDAFDVMSGPGGFALRLVDMSRAKAALGELRRTQARATYTHLIVRAAALALARNPDLHKIVCGYKRYTPGAVDIGLSMAGSTTYAPVVVLPSTNLKVLPELVPSMNDAITAAREKEKVDLANMRKLGWLMPLSFLRKFIIRFFNRMFWFRRKLVGTFQVSCLGNVDVIASFLFHTGSILGAGSVQDRVVAIGGEPVVRPSVWLTVCVDHNAMDGMGAAKLLHAIKGILEGEELLAEVKGTGAGP